MFSGQLGDLSAKFRPDENFFHQVEATRKRLTAQIHMLHVFSLPYSRCCGDSRACYSGASLKERAFPQGQKEAIVAMAQISIPPPILPTIPSRRPVAAPPPERRESRMFLPSLLSPNSAPRKAPPQAPKTDPTIGIGRRKVPRSPPTRLPARAQRAPLREPPDIRAPAAPAAPRRERATGFGPRAATSIAPGTTRRKSTAPICRSRC